MTSLAHLFFSSREFLLTAITLPSIWPKTLGIAEAAELAEKRRMDLEAAIVQHSNDAIFSHTSEGVITNWNSAAERLYGYAASEIIGRNMTLIFPDGLPVEVKEAVACRKDGGRADVAITLSPIGHCDRDGGASVIARDITEWKRANLRLLESQKLESLGVIAGGVAHEFNNLLVSMVGSASFALDCLPSADPTRVLLQTVVDAGERASNLTRQLLAYAGKGRLVTSRVNLNELICQIASLLNNVRPGVELVLDLAPELPAIETDPNQLQQVPINLAINGAEAIAGGESGTVSITTAVRVIGPATALCDLAGSPLSPGRYVSLEVRDTGSGMSDAVRARIFDPFFSTRFAGRGLGLAAVHGIVRSHGGAILVESAPGKGTTITVLLPAEVKSRISPPAAQSGDPDNQ